FFFQGKGGNRNFMLLMEFQLCFFRFFNPKNLPKSFFGFNQGFSKIAQRKKIFIFFNLCALFSI
ncbi:hypothetical protein, partial [Chryseobacterium sp. VD8]|uniref:hypothetical protein n=1 Tax=Chryseobacterium sp. VD8 TaxID=3081254 RepID=UPI00301B0E39